MERMKIDSLVQFGLRGMKRWKIMASVKNLSGGNRTGHTISGPIELKRKTGKTARQAAKSRRKISPMPDVLRLIKNLFVSGVARRPTWLSFPDSSASILQGRKRPVVQTNAAIFLRAKKNAPIQNKKRVYQYALPKVMNMRRSMWQNMHCSKITKPLAEPWQL